VADSAITVGVASILLFQRAYFNDLPAPTPQIAEPIEPIQEIDNQPIAPSIEAVIETKPIENHPNPE
jgi:hypothetical protein